MKIRTKLALIISIAVSSNAMADVQNTNNKNVDVEKILNQNVGKENEANKELPHFDASKYDAKYKGLIQLLNEAQLSEGEYLGVKRIVETQKENPALEM